MADPTPSAEQVESAARFVVRMKQKLALNLTDDETDALHEELELRDAALLKAPEGIEPQRTRRERDRLMKRLLCWLGVHRFGPKPAFAWLGPLATFHRPDCCACVRCGKEMAPR